MAGMFYSLQEAAEKLGISEEELKQWAKDGKLRDFRDGQSVMFKVDEIEALLDQSDSEVDDLDLPVLDLEGSEEQDLPNLESALDLDLDEESEAKPEPAGEPEASDEGLSLDEPLELAPESETAESDTGLDDLMLSMDDDEGSTEEATEESTHEQAAEDQADSLLESVEEDESTLSLSDTQLIADQEPTPAEDLELDEISDDVLSDATGTADSDSSELSSMDTALTGEGVDIFGGSEAEFKLSDDSMAETMAGLGESGEASSLEEIEEDVNLDSFGSGSGLLDLSLQADDTSLGGILDEIYTAEEEDAVVSEGTVEDMTEAADSVQMEEAPMAAALPVMATTTTVADVPPDAQSNFFGGLLFLPLLLLLYTGIAALSGMMGGLNILISPLKGIVWYVIGGLVVLALILTAVGFTRGDSAGPKAAKKTRAKKEKKPKKVKAKKEKKVKEKKTKGGKKK